MKSWTLFAPMAQNKFVRIFVASSPLSAGAFDMRYAL
jgi:hypothetical protein